MRDTPAPDARLPSVWNIEDIMRHLRHRYPFLLVDRIVSMEEHRTVTGFKNVTINEPFFGGHFPGHPVMPGVLIIEAMSQVAGCLAYADSALRGRPAYLVGIDEARFRRMVIPGDRLMIRVDMVRWRLGLMKVRGWAHVDGDLAAEALLSFHFLPESGDATSKPEDPGV